MRTRWHRFTVCAVLSFAAACGGSNGSKPDGNGGIDGTLGNQPQCNDGIDNDGDGKIDYPNDPGCVSPNENSELDDCPNGPMCPECSNGKDDDGNGLIDYPADPGLFVRRRSDRVLAQPRPRAAPTPWSSSS